MSEQVLFTVKDGIAQLSINRPEALNALNCAVSEEIGQYVDKVAKDKTIKVLVVGSEKNFASGADVKEFYDFSPEMVRAGALPATCDRLQQLAIPTIAAVEGYALGGGTELALACGFRIAAKSAQMGLPEINLGIFPGGGGVVRLPRLIGESRAKEIIFMGRPVTAEKALAIGLVNEIAEDGQAIAAALEMAGRLAKKSATAISAAKVAIAAGQREADVYAACDIAKYIFSFIMGTKDQKEGMTAFIEKRKPSFTGQRDH